MDSPDCPGDDGVGVVGRVVGHSNEVTSVTFSPQTRVDGREVGLQRAEKAGQPVDDAGVDIATFLLQEEQVVRHNHQGDELRPGVRRHVALGVLQLAALVRHMQRTDVLTVGLTTIVRRSHVDQAAAGLTWAAGVEHLQLWPEQVGRQLWVPNEDAGIDTGLD